MKRRSSALDLVCICCAENIDLKKKRKKNSAVYYLCKNKKRLILYTAYMHNIKIFGYIIMNDHLNRDISMFFFWMMILPFFLLTLFDLLIACLSSSISVSDNICMDSWKCISREAENVYFYTSYFNTFSLSAKIVKFLAVFIDQFT